MLSASSWTRLSQLERTGSLVRVLFIDFYSAFNTILSVFLRDKVALGGGPTPLRPQTVKHIWLSATQEPHRQRFQLCSSNFHVQFKHLQLFDDLWTVQRWWQSTGSWCSEDWCQQSWRDIKWADCNRHYWRPFGLLASFMVWPAGAVEPLQQKGTGKTTPFRRQERGVTAVMVAKLSSLLEIDSPLLYDTVTNSSFNDRLLHQVFEGEIMEVFPPCCSDFTTRHTPSKPNTMIYIATVIRWTLICTVIFRKIW